MEIIETIINKYARRGKYTPAGSVDVRLLCNLVKDFEKLLEEAKYKDVIEVNKVFTNRHLILVEFERKFNKRN